MTARTAYGSIFPVFAALLLGCGDKEPSRLLWKFEAGHKGPLGPPAYSASVSAPTVVDGVVYFGSFDGHVYAVDAKTGKEKWAFRTGAGVRAQPAVADGVVYVGSLDKRLYALDAATGKLKWLFPTQGKIGQRALVSESLVYIGSDSIYALDAATGQQKWKLPQPIEHAQGPVVVGGLLCVGVTMGEIGSGFRDYLLALEPQTGKVSWEMDLTDQKGLSVPSVLADGVLYLACGDTHVYAVDPLTRKVLWDFDAAGNANKVPPVVSQGVLYLVTGAGYVYAVDLKARAAKWSLKMGDVTLTGPLLADGVLYLGSSDGHLHALDPASGRELWRFKDLGRWVRGPDFEASGIRNLPALADGVLYVGSMDGNLYALDAKGKPPATTRKQ